MGLEARKDEHIEVCLSRDVEDTGVTTWFEYVYLPHRCLPEVDPSEVRMETDFLGFRFAAPLMVSAMTGGSRVAYKVNSRIAEAVERLKLGMCVGSQRVALENPDTAYSFKVVREKAPTVFVSANIGFQELYRYGVGELEKLIGMVEADALTVHLNALQELLQPEGEPRFKGLTEIIGEVADRLPVPVIVKETGAGVGWEDAVRLEEAGVDAVDVAGAGGTSWSKVEYYRALDRGERFKARVAEGFWGWGIPTAASLVEVKSKVRRLKVVASGGLRSGVDIAKAICLGADMTAVALPILKPALKSVEAVEETLKVLVEGLRNAMILVGASSLEELKKVKPVVTGRLAEWVERRLGFEGSARGG